METYERQTSFYEKAKTLQNIKPEVLLRIEGDGKQSIDMMAAEVCYHDNCMKKFMATPVSFQACDLCHEAFCAQIEEIDSKRNNGALLFSSILRDDYKKTSTN